tara:strand:+ start:1243 stop:1800 length:558 start_codon:yes stop_codon:yes gene_type:complete
MNLENLDKILNKYGKEVVAQAKENLQNADPSKGGGALEDSISYELDTEKDFFLLDFLMESYGKFVDQGVQGKDPNEIYKNNDDKKGVQKAPLSKFKYTNKMPPMQILADWAKKKNIRFRNKLGQYQKGTNIQMGFALQRSIYYQGIKPTFFFSKPYNRMLKKLDNEIFKAFVLDIEEAIILGKKQ